MRRLNKENKNTPKLFNEHFHGSFALYDIDRLEKLVKYYKGGCYLDVGCFDSPMPVILSERYPGAEIYALDFATDVIEFLKQRFTKVNYVLGQATALPFEDDTFDYVVAGEIIEHMDDPIEFIRECSRVLRTGGYFALSTPNEESDRQEVGGESHVWSFTQNDFKDLGFETEIWGDGHSKTILAWKQKLAQSS